MYTNDEKKAIQEAYDFGWEMQNRLRVLAKNPGLLGEVSIEMLETLKNFNSKLHRIRVIVNENKE